MKKLMLEIFFTFFIACSAYADNIVKLKEGTYELTGNCDGSDRIMYRGNVVIIAQGDTYSLLWKNPSMPRANGSRT